MSLGSSINDVTVTRGKRFKDFMTTVYKPYYDKSVTMKGGGYQEDSNLCSVIDYLYQQQYDSLVNLQNTLDAAKEVRSVPISGQNEGIGSVIFFYFGNLQEFDVNGTQRFGRQTWTKPVEQIFCHLGRL